jgi:hypothetical protein
MNRRLSPTHWLREALPHAGSWDAGLAVGTNVTVPSPEPPSWVHLCGRVVGAFPETG